MNHNRFAGLLFSVVIVAVGVALIVGSATAQSGDSPHDPAVPSAALGTAFTYQGTLKKSDAPLSGVCDFRFTLWDAVSSGAQQGITQTLASLGVVNGLFTVQLDFGNQFTGEARWLQTDVKCAGDPGFTTLTPRQAVTAAPYAVGLRPGALISGTGLVGLSINTPNGNALVANGKSNGYAVVYVGDASPTGGYGVYGSSNTGIGTYGSSGGRAGVLGVTSAPNGSGVEGDASGSNAAGVFGVNTTGPGVWGRGTSGGSGVFGESSGYAVYGASTGGFGVYGTSTNGGVVGVAYVGVQGNANGTTDSQGVRGDNGGSNTVGYAGLFNGRVSIFGNLNVYGTLAKSAGAFKIDHPLDPANKYLYHSFVESPDMKNIYDGVVMTDANGNATVVLPDYFEALNKDFRYQLTVIGQFAQAIVSSEIDHNRFSIKTDKPGVKVSWQVTGIRHDPYAEANRIPVEEIKPAGERGQYVYPELYGLPSSSSINSLIPAGATPDVNTPPSRPIDPPSGGK